jgi:Ser/Thr protein kinase RdoA (MazF antagonist)
MPAENNAQYQDDILKSRSPSFSIDQVADRVNQLFGLSGDLFPMVSERDQNFRFTTDQGDRFVIKIANSAEDAAIIDMQLKALQHIAQVDAELPVPSVLNSHNGCMIEQIEDENGTKHSFRILTYVPGLHPQDDPANDVLLYPMGNCLAKLVQALRGFFHPAANYELLWDLKNSSQLRQYLPHVSDISQRNLAAYFLDRFDLNVLSRITGLRAQIVHNDLVPDNILVAEDDPGSIVGIIDFGDMVHTALVNDLATTIAPTIVGHDEPLEAAAKILAGYHELVPVEEVELSLLYDLIGVRLTMLNVIASWRATIHPYNLDYITGGVNEVWPTLETWRAQNPDEVRKKFFRTCGFWEMYEGVSLQNESNETLENHISRRDRLLGPTPTFSMINPYILCAVKESGYMMTKETGTWMHITMSPMSVTVTRMLSTKSPGNRGG